MSLTDWMLRDRSGLTWTLTGSIGANQSRTFRRNGQGLSLDNSGDEFVLIDGQRAERDRFEYSASTEDVAILTSR